MLALQTGIAGRGFGAAGEPGAEQAAERGRHVHDLSGRHDQGAGRLAAPMRASVSRRVHPNLARAIDRVPALQAIRLH